MMANKHLHELLKEEQEPFQLKDYIALRKSQLKNSPKTPRFPKNCKKAPSNCLFSVQYSPEVINSPLIDFPSQMPVKSPNKSPKRVPVRLQVPARTAALLFEAAIKIQTNKKPRNQIRSIGFNLFGSILRKFGAKNRAGKCGIGSAVGGSGISNLGRVCSVISRTVSNEVKSSSTEFDAGESESFGYFQKHFCSSPMSPFRFALQHCPSPSPGTPIFLSPMISPSRRQIQENENCKSEEEEDEKEQFSPVSVLDPPFDDDDGIGHDDGDDEDNYEIECSYKFVLRAKHQLLHKLRRFEKLAELDPIELEKIMLEDEENDDHHAEAFYSTFYRKQNEEDNDVLGQSDISGDMKKLVFDLIEEENLEGCCEGEVAKFVHKRLDSWKDVQPNTIDMMVESDFQRGTEEWKGYCKDETSRIASEIGAALFGCLVEELFTLPRAF